MLISLKIVIGVLALLFCTSLSAQTRNWKMVTSIPEDGLVSGQLYFPDSVHGYLIARKTNDASVPAYDNVCFYRTLDGGLTWLKIDFRSILGQDTGYYTSDFTFRFDAISPNSCLISNAEAYNPQDNLTFYWSENNGSSWFPTRTFNGVQRSDYLIEAAPHDHEVVGLRINNYYPGAHASGQFEVSATNGTVFDDIRWDSTLLQNILIQNSDYHLEVNNHGFDFFDDYTWIITVSDNSNSEITDPEKPYTLVTLLAKDLDSDADPGTYWEAYPNVIPDFPSSLTANYFDIHCVRGTESVYLFSGYGGQGQSPFYGINFLYSSDQGRYWNIDSSFVTGGASYRRGYAVSAPSEVWSTVIPPFTTIYPNTPAIWISHSTNDGKTWNIDSLSLFVNENEYYDGKNMTFSDRNHGWMFAQSVKTHNSAIFRYEGLSNSVNDMPKINRIVLSAYPNPAVKDVTIGSPDIQGIDGVEVFDLLGRKWSCPYVIKNESHSATIKTAALPAGSYLAQIRASNGTAATPFMVIH
jgi:hypothetical protein